LPRARLTDEASALSRIHDRASAAHAASAGGSGMLARTKVCPFEEAIPGGSAE